MNPETRTEGGARDSARLLPVAALALLLAACGGGGGDAPAASPAPPPAPAPAPTPQPAPTPSPNPGPAPAPTPAPTPQPPAPPPPPTPSPALSTHSAYIAKPNSYDTTWRLNEAQAVKAVVLTPAYTPAPPNAHGWTHQATHLGSGLYRIALQQGHFYRFSSLNEWSGNLTIYDAAGYQLYAGLGELDRKHPLDDPLTYELLALRDGAVFIQVEAVGGSPSERVDLRLETTGASLGGDAGAHVNLATQGQGLGAAQAHAAYHGGTGKDHIIGKPQAPNSIFGGAGDDLIELKTQAETVSRVDGGLARDTLVVGFHSTAAKLTRLNAYGPYRHLPPNGSQPDAHALTGSPDGAVLIVRSIERVQFSDKAMEFKDLPGH